ncbi:hypothetical protein Poly51_12420 [Rubripirellula tenax]|uniref:Uncharacterized protein n=1 Tax=Rubripirellula tenax TaxID=2528015 RepID=A0A5C6FE44_9BACT|nr:hypothetical protein [Rubripirellula tenax]TWU58464.1 hypothetical protein Poly51_12420 [Rubripirellula tenax]
MSEPFDLSLSVHRCHIHPWIVCESPSKEGAPDRWAIASRQFAREMVDPPTILAIESVDAIGQPDRVRVKLVGHTAAVVIWEVQRDHLVVACDRIAQLSIASPTVLQVAVGREIPTAGKWALWEFGVAAILRNVEDLPGITPMVRRYFARATHYQDRPST